MVIPPIPNYEVLRGRDIKTYLEEVARDVSAAGGSEADISRRVLGRLKKDGTYPFAIHVQGVVHRLVAGDPLDSSHRCALDIEQGELIGLLDKNLPTGRMRPRKAVGPDMSL
jgi:hypothetical protein